MLALGRLKGGRRRPLHTSHALRLAPRPAPTGHQELRFDAGDGAAKAALIVRCLAYALAVELLAGRAEEGNAALPR